MYTKLNFDDYPELLKEINDPPNQLYVRGNLISPNKVLCVVGSRKFSAYGKEACVSLIKQLCGYPITIVSGLAIGIDAIAHEAALECGLHTIAVPGSGLNDSVLYPRSNRNLAHAILESDGALVSEYEPDFKAQAWSFPRRNRIMAGLSHAVLIVEAQEKSGTLVTARLAADYNRDVLAIPGSIFSPNSKGPHMLIKIGATPVTQIGDILAALGLEQHQYPTPSKVKPIPSDLSPDEMVVYTMLEHPRSRDELIRNSLLSPSSANALLAMMELSGHIHEIDGFVSRT